MTWMLFSAGKISGKETEVIGKIDDLRSQLNYALNTPLRWSGLLRRNTFARAIMGSNSIEGYNVSLEDAIAAAEGEEPVEAVDETWAAVSGYRAALTYILQLANDPHFVYHEGFIRALHYMMIGFDLTKNPGKWRPGHIYVRHEPSGEIVYEGPEADRVPKLTGELIQSLNDGAGEEPVIVRAAMGHLNLVMIHPFSDGNGRMARALQTLVLAREGILAPPFSSIEEYLGRNTPAYYQVLADVGGGRWQPERDTRLWIRFCLKAHFQQAQRLLRRTREIGRLWDELDSLVERSGLPSRVMFALADAAMNLRVRSGTYRAAVAEDISGDLASRDLKLLVEKRLLIPHGERRGRYYTGSQRILKLRQITQEPKREDDPFGEEREPLLPGVLSD